jgi:hypothetical protein
VASNSGQLNARSSSSRKVTMIIAGKARMIITPKISTAQA